jgi:hypothetical protein
LSGLTGQQKADVLQSVVACASRKFSGIFATLIGLRTPPGHRIRRPCSCFAKISNGRGRHRNERETRQFIRSTQLHTCRNW